ncbi:MAG: GGDEF domain-containing protein, partial [candidate division KSB1 bacterium]|nr:GGDEF domain-containing protein [candidate division KSB1 bacterium]
MEAQLKNIKYKLQRNLLGLTRRFRLAEPNFYSLESFKQRLAIEKRRSERLNYKSSIIFFGVKNLISDNGHLNAVSIEDFVKLICSNIRCTDAVTIYQKQTILMLLPDTSNYGAQCACERLVAVILNRYSHSTELTPDDFHIKILSFPEHQILELNENDLLNDAPKFERSHLAQPMSRSDELTFKNEYFDNLNVCLSTFNGSTISMPIFETFFWDQQL